MQNRVAGTLSVDANLVKVRMMFEKDPPSTCTSAAERVCEAFGFRDYQGRLQVKTCMTALRRLERQQQLQLPAVRAGGYQRSVADVAVPPPVPVGVPDRVDQLEELSVDLVGSAAERLLHDQLLRHEHPQGDRLVTGRQLRYLLRCEHGVLGAVAVSAAALHLEARDRYIGWDWPLRQKYLERVVCLSRLLIRPRVACANLASKAISLLLARVGEDFQERYGFTPWLVESFVDPAHHQGICFRAANFDYVGQTKGRGRNDRQVEVGESIKDVYVYCLAPDFRQHLGLPADAGAVALAAGDGLDADQWAQKEFGSSDLGDRRLTKRLISIAQTKATSPTESFSRCANGEHAQMQGYYRFMEHTCKDDKEGKDGKDDPLTMLGILSGHRERTVKRMRNQTRVLCPQDTSVLDFNHLPQCNGLGRTGANSKGAKGRGLSLHSTLAVSADDGLPLGIVHAQCKPRKFYPGKTREQRRKLPFEEKETYRWLESVEACEALAEELPGVCIVNVMDREGDIFEVLYHHQQQRRVQLLIRASKNRKSDLDSNLFSELRNSPLQARIEINIAHRRDKKRRRVPTDTELELRYKQVSLQVPKHCQIPNAQPITVWMVHAYETTPPPNTKRIEWFLISTEEVADDDKAQQCLREYGFRWRIEEWHRVLKSGCKTEDKIADDAESLRREIAIDMVIGWRVMLMTLLGRGSEANAPADILFSELELKVLTHVSKQLRCPQPKTVAKAVYIVARLGGYRGRRSDGPPGTIVLWRGYRELQSMVRGAALFFDSS